ncbi:unnamed protein product [Vitrella brassicaformis CCMP3155]|uniref:Uncharacterized protein n=2 Tax=Vitrella brassicaformis TaxID=1169539 RepID=A0A0G4EJA8_VITBC|nr:unnamed protein product [Vitrella brassicaformis CCMP3155]|eukprot:CEL96809.1 unnamed protein product [Vitrella brassicaformis CCMP3155]
MGEALVEKQQERTNQRRALRHKQAHVHCTSAAKPEQASLEKSRPIGDLRARKRRNRQAECRGMGSVLCGECAAEGAVEQEAEASDIALHHVEGAINHLTDTTEWLDGLEFDDFVTFATPLTQPQVRPPSRGDDDSHPNQRLSAKRPAPLDLSKAKNMTNRPTDIAEYGDDAPCRYGQRGGGGDGEVPAVTTDPFLLSLSTRGIRPGSDYWERPDVREHQAVIRQTWGSPTKFERIAELLVSSREERARRCHEEFLTLKAREGGGESHKAFFGMGWLAGWAKGNTWLRSDREAATEDGG